MKAQSQITILMTGGTIDSYFDAVKESVLISDREAVKEYLSTLSLHLGLHFKSICRKDSREIVDEDRENILKAIQACDANLFLVTHGTYTMPDTARYLHERRDQLKGKTVIFTGSMKPLQGFYDSDAPFNLGFAIASLLHLEAGIYVAMNGDIFLPEDVYKDVEKGKFEYVKNPK